jgi:uncharacterized protein
VIMLLAKSPYILILEVFMGMMILAMSILMHAVTLPVEFDASFNRALLLLREGRFVPSEDLGAARHILTAAAYTYVAGALIDIINLPRWIRGLW